ncbi:MAG: hypothetical protein HKN29_04575 [Rhodothermales bacterium]|nr:hypothetical protein [Rhodothermales bacterium]
MTSPPPASEEAAEETAPEPSISEPADDHESDDDHEPADDHTSADDHESADDRTSDDDQEPEPLWARFRAEAPSPRPPEPEDEEEEQPLWKQFQDGASPAGLTPIPVPEEGPRKVQLHPTPGPTPETELDSASLEFAVLGPAAWQRDTFIDKLFGGSAEAYFDALARVLKAKDWREASSIVAVDVFRTNRVNIYDEAAIDFTNAVEAQFKKR